MYTFICTVRARRATAIYTLMWISGWASCGRVLQFKIYCFVFGWLGSALVVWSAGIIVIMTSCRYLSLAKPLYYRAHVKPRRVTYAAVGTLVFCLAFFIFPFTGLTSPFVVYDQNNVCATDFAPGSGGVGQRIFIGAIGVIGSLTVLHVVVCNISIARTLRQRNEVRVASSVTAITEPRSTSLVLGRRRIFGRVTLVVSFVYALCYAPFVVSFACFGFQGGDDGGSDEKGSGLANAAVAIVVMVGVVLRLLVDTVNNLPHQNNLIHSVTMSLLFLSPLLNPIIYGIFNKQFRKAFFGLFHLRVKFSPNSRTRSGTADPRVHNRHSSTRGGANRGTSNRGEMCNRKSSANQLAAEQSFARGGGRSLCTVTVTTTIMDNYSEYSPTTVNPS
ncbi:uncharacterized protein LOC101864102 [Aplysia californica]|uniref:Uncharacterized protein LOC101864102 n=1 Tax=Aplysia californica TaxID=6500 RepID=A0ABM1W258_APLCA|nr:uncharacterized protein LOC101864102 [Aplysia californica]